MALLILSHIIFRAGFAYTFSLFSYLLVIAPNRCEELALSAADFIHVLPSPQRQVSVKGWLTVFVVMQLIYCL